MSAPNNSPPKFRASLPAIALGGHRAPDILRANWRDDANAERVLRAVGRRSVMRAAALALDNSRAADTTD